HLHDGNPRPAYARDPANGRAFEHGRQRRRAALYRARASDAAQACRPQNPRQCFRSLPRGVPDFGWRCSIRDGGGAAVQACSAGSIARFVGRRAACMMKKILLVEDEALIAESVSLLLEDEGYSVTVAYNGADGIAAAR